MKKTLLKSGLAACALVALVASAGAAELVQLEGKVAVNSGDGFVPGKPGMVLKAGDQVLVGEKSTASLVYADPGCVFEVAASSLVTVSDVGPCVPGQSTALGESVFVQPTATEPTYTDGPDLTPFYIMGGGAIIGSAAFMIHEATNNNGSGNGNGGGGPGGPGPSPN